MMADDSGGHMNVPKELNMMIEKLDALPPIPRIAQKILKLSVITEEGERELFNLIEKDPALMAKIIGLSNSPHFYRGRTVVTLHDAEAVLGSKRIKMTALGFAMMSSIAKKSSGLLDFDALWMHSLSIAMAMNTLAGYMPKNRRPPVDAAYLARLLHDIGFLVLNYIDSKLCDQFCIRMLAKPALPVVEIEAEILDMNHCELGSELARHWSLPENITAVLQYHHTPADNPEEAQQPLVNLAYMAEKLLPAFDTGEFEPTNIGAAEWQYLGINPLLADDIIAKVKRHTDQVVEITT